MFWRVRVGLFEIPVINRCLNSAAFSQNGKISCPLSKLKNSMLCRRPFARCGIQSRCRALDLVKAVRRKRVATQVSRILLSLHGKGKR
jgi:hypothetical protein